LLHIHRIGHLARSTLYNTNGAMCINTTLCINRQFGYSIPYIEEWGFYPLFILKYLYSQDNLLSELDR